MTAQTITQEPLQTATTNTRKGSTVQAAVSVDDELLLFDPLSGCLLVVPAESAKPFLQEANLMHSLAADLHAAREAVLGLEDKLVATKAQRFPSLTEQQSLKQELAAAVRKYDAAYEAVKKELGEKGYLTPAGDGKKLLELLPLAKRKQGGKPAEWGRKWTYVRSDKIKNHFRSYKLSQGDSQDGQKKSFVRDGKVDTGELRKQITKIEPKLKAEWGLAAGFMFPNLQAWADTLNVKADPSSPAQFNAAVHLFRYFAGCGASLEWKPKDGKVGGKINGKAELMLAYGECKVEGFTPSAEGWALMMTGANSGRDFHIGAVRLAGSAKLVASAGASVAAELAAEVDYSDIKDLGIKGAKRGKNVESAGRKVKLADLGTSASVGGDLFAGAKAGGELSGALQFLNPEKGDKFTDMAKIGPKIELQFGAGAAAAFMVTFDGSKFRCKVKAGVCLGPGAKGEFALEVDARRVVSFLEWFFHALLNAGFEFLEIITRQGYEAAMRLQVLIVSGVETAYKNVNLAWQDLADRWDREDFRIALMNRVLAEPPMLRHCTPEAHGILLWHLSRHGTLTKTTHAWSNSEDFELLGKRKRAIYQVCRWAQCRSQFENMVQHMGAAGEKGSFQANYAHLLRFMEIGLGDSKYDEDLQRLYRRLPLLPPSGYAVAQNHTPHFLARATMGPAPNYVAQVQGLHAGATA